VCTPSRGPVEHFTSAGSLSSPASLFRHGHAGVPTIHIDLPSAIHRPFVEITIFEFFAFIVEIGEESLLFPIQILALYPCLLDCFFFGHIRHCRISSIHRPVRIAVFPPLVHPHPSTFRVPTARDERIRGRS